MDYAGVPLVEKTHSRTYSRACSDRHRRFAPETVWIAITNVTKLPDGAEATTHALR